DGGDGWGGCAPARLGARLHPCARLPARPRPAAPAGAIPPAALARPSGHGLTITPDPRPERPRPARGPHRRSSTLSRFSRCLAAASLVAISSAAHAEAEANVQNAVAPQDEGGGSDILVTTQRQAQSIENAPSSRASIDAETIDATINAINVEDTL